MEKTAKIFIVGDKSIVGSALIQYFRSCGFANILSESVCSIDLLDQYSVYSFFKSARPEYVFLTYVVSGGIAANIEYPADFIYRNLQIQNNIIHNSYQFGVNKLAFWGSSCAYPRDCPQPIKEEYFLTGELERTSEPYAVAKIAGMKMCQSYCRQYGVDYISLIPATIYGPNDDFELESSHVIPSLIKRFHEAKEDDEPSIVVWGTGEPRREFLFIDDAVDAGIFLLSRYSMPEIINVGCGEDISIKGLAELIKEIVGYEGQVLFDKSKPDGAPRKLLDNSKITDLGWKARVSLGEGIRQTYNWYKETLVCAY